MEILTGPEMNDSSERRAPPSTKCQNCGREEDLAPEEYCSICKRAFAEGLHHGYDCGREDARKTAQSFSVSRFELIGKDGREVVLYEPLRCQVQDDGRTLKVFRRREA